MSSGTVALVCTLSIVGICCLIAIVYCLLRVCKNILEASSDDNLENIKQNLDETLYNEENEIRTETLAAIPMVEPRDMYAQAKIPKNSSSEEKSSPGQYDIQKGFGLSTTGTVAFPSVTSQITSTFDLSD